MGIEYDGTAYNGWQKQNVGTGIQSVVEDAVSEVADKKIDVICAGRTDSGVHAVGQVVHYDTTADRSEYEWQSGVNSLLSDDINVKWTKIINQDFHARFSAVNRTYRYIILNRKVRSSLLRKRCWWVHQDIDDSLMKECASNFIGKHDFSSFRASTCQASSPIREIYNLDINRENEFVIITIKANAFLQKMVRNIVGSMVQVGRKEKETGWLTDAFKNKDRRSAGITAPPHGLCLIEVRYPEEFGISSINNYEIL